MSVVLSNRHQYIFLYGWVKMADTNNEISVESTKIWNRLHGLIVLHRCAARAHRFASIRIQKIS
jgi:hypothetical protein